MGCAMRARRADAPALDSSGHRIMLSDAERLAQIDQRLRHSNLERLEEIGRGSQAAVYRLYDRALNRDAAIKVWLPAVGDGVDGNESYWEGKRALAKLTHGNIVPIYTLDSEMGWVVMELMARSFQPEFAEGPLGFDRARFMLRQAMKALSHLHARCGLLHGAIKPTNILIDIQGTVKIADALGIPLLESSQTIAEGDLPVLVKAITTAGPPVANVEIRQPVGKYLAPEAINPEFGPVGQWVDQYCLGFAVLQLLVGPHFDELFQGVGSEAADSELAWMRWHGSNSPLPPVRDLLKGIPSDLAAVLERLCQKRVDARFPDATEALHGLKGQNQGPPLPASARGGVPARRANLPAKIGPGRGAGTSTGRFGALPPTAVRNPFLVEAPEPWSADWVKLKFKEPKARRRVGATLAAVCLCLVLLGLIPPQPMHPVEIRTTPGGATVVLDGDKQLGQTPLQIGILPGNHSLELRLADYHPLLLKQVEVRRGEGVQKLGPYTLDPIRRTAKVESTPQGARVFLDNEDKKVSTPTTIEMSLGEHSLKLVKQGYQPLLVPPFKCQEGDGVMELGPYELALKDRAVRIFSDPQDAQVYRDGMDLQKVTPADLDLPTGIHRLRLVHDGYRDREVTLEVTPGDGVQESEVYRLVPIVRTVTVAITSEPAGAEVSLRKFGDQEAVQRLRTPGEVRLSPDTSWTLSATLVGYQEATRELAVESDGAPRRVHFDLRPPQRISNKIGMDFVWVAPGEFVMGGREPVGRLGEATRRPARAASPRPIAVAGIHVLGRPGVVPPSRPAPSWSPRPAGVAGQRPGGDQAARAVADEYPRHVVALTRPFYCGTTEVTQAQFQEVMGFNPSYFRPGVAAGLADTRDHPVERVSYFDALEFCRRLAELDGLRPGSYRLPTEAEWEYVARGGPAQPAPDPAAAPETHVDEGGWLAPESGGVTRPVGRQPPNPLGIFDLSGNVEEWTSDWYDAAYYAESPRSNPIGPSRPTNTKVKVIRGGGFQTRRESYRISDRASCTPSVGDRTTLGFRVVREAR
jgi:formylglycine-generating enzyme required for sulfatase activity